MTYPPRMRLGVYAALLVPLVAACSSDKTPPSTAKAMSSMVCDSRVGGAKITIKVNDQTFTFWSTNAGFIARAKQMQSSSKKATAMFSRLIDGRDCDEQWTFHPDAAEMSWPALTIEGCDGRPSDIESDKLHWINDVKRWCPWSTEVLAVDQH